MNSFKVMVHDSEFVTSSKVSNYKMEYTLLLEIVPSSLLVLVSRLTTDSVIS